MKADELVACTFVDDKGRKCSDMIRNHKGTIRAHMRTKHGVDNKAAEEAEAVKAELASFVPADKSQHESKDSRVLDHNLRAAKIQQKMLDEVRATAPDATMSLPNQKNELKTWVDYARKIGLVRPDESTYWAENTKLDLEALNGREIVELHGAPLRVGENTLTKMPKVITDAKTKAFHAEVQNRMRNLVQEGKAAVSSKAPSTVKASD